jgi:hypothetical protein
VSLFLGGVGAFIGAIRCHRGVTFWVWRLTFTVMW